MRLYILLIPLLFGCGPSDAIPKQQEPHFRATPVLAGRLENRDINEASGLARSQEHAGVFWVINDSGKPRLHAIDARGRTLGRIKIIDAKLSDWEDIASFSLDGDPYLLVADIGDNDNKRKDVRFYVVEEPESGEKKTEIAWQFDYSYPGGPRDAEAVAVDVDNERVLVLSKREIPAVLYELPLRPGTKKRQKATRLGEIASLPRPRRQDVEFAPATDNYWWQPTGMDFAGDGRAAVILTYRGIYYYRRSADETWLAALQKKPVALSIGDYREAESVAFNADADAVYITFEGRGAPLVRIKLEGVRSP